MDVHIKLGAPPPFNSVHLNLMSYFDLSKPSDSSCWMHFLYLFSHNSTCKRFIAVRDILEPFGTFFGICFMDGW